MPGERDDWFYDCLSSLRREPVTVRVCAGIPGDIGAARTKAFQLGDNLLVAFVDPDDLVVPGIFAKLIAHLEENPGAVMACSNEMLIGEEAEFLTMGFNVDPKPFLAAGHDLAPFLVGERYIHHLRVMRRDAVGKCLPLKTKRFSEPALMRDLAKIGPFVHLHDVGYRWRIHPGNSFPKFTDAERAELAELK